MNQWLTNLQNLLKPEDTTDDADEITLPSSAAHPADEEAEMLHDGKRRIKESYTSHWDLDYLPRAEVDRILGEIEQDKLDDNRAST